MGNPAEGQETVEVCMAVRKGEHVLTNRETLEAGGVISGATEKISKGNVKTLILEDYTERGQVPHSLIGKNPYSRFVPW